MTLSLSGVGGKTYALSVWNPSQVASVTGGKIEEAHADLGSLVVEFRAGSEESYVRQDVILNFAHGK